MNNQRKIQEEISHLFETCMEQFEQISSYDGKIPQIEIDIIMNNIRNIYDQLGQLNQLNHSNETKVDASSKPELKQNVNDQSQPVVNEIKPELNKKEEEIESPGETFSINNSDIETGKSPDTAASGFSQKESISQKNKANTKTAGLFDQNAESDDDDSEIPSINDRMNKSKNENSLADRLKQNRVKDLKQAIGINEKFLFINELFEGSLNDYNNAITQLNSLSSKGEAEKYIDSELKMKFKWNDSSKAHSIFVQLIERRFS